MTPTPTTIRLRPDEHKLLERLIKQTGLSMADVIRQALRAYAEARLGK